MHADFEQHGAETIERVRIEKPEAYLATVAKILPQEAVVKHDATEAFARLWSAVSDGSIREMADSLAEQPGQAASIRH